MWATDPSANNNSALNVVAWGHPGQCSWRFWQGQHQDPFHNGLVTCYFPPATRWPWQHISLWLSDYSQTAHMPSSYFLLLQIVLHQDALLLSETTWCRLWLRMDSFPPPLMPIFFHLVDINPFTNSAHLLLRPLEPNLHDSFAFQVLGMLTVYRPQWESRRTLGLDGLVLK